MMNGFWRYLEPSEMTLRSVVQRNYSSSGILDVAWEFHVDFRASKAKFTDYFTVSDSVGNYNTVSRYKNWETEVGLG